MKILNIVKKLNNLISEAVWHGADAGGSYNQNEENLLKAMDSIIEYLGLDKEYEAVNCRKNGIVVTGIEYGSDCLIIPKGTVENASRDKVIYVHFD